MEATLNPPQARAFASSQTQGASKPTQPALTPEQIKALANAKLDSLRSEAQDVACSTAWDRVMSTSTVVAAGMAVTLPLGGMAGVMGLAAWGLGAVTVAIGGVMFAWREGQDIYSGDPGAIDRWLPDEDWAALANRAEQVKLAAEEAIKKPLGAVDTSLAANNPSLENTECLQTETCNGSPEAATTAPDRTVDRLLWRDGEHLVLIGLSGSSKTTTLVDCVPSTAPVIYITLKSEDKAPEGWRAYRLRKFADQAFLQQLDDLCSMLTGLVQAKAQHRLIIDEALTILDQAKDAQKTLTDKEDKAVYGAVAARFEGLLKMYIRTGRSDGHWLGLVTQSPNGTDLFGSAKTMQGLKTVLCAGEASSNRFDFVVSWAKQLYGQFVTDADEQRLRSTQSGFWHFWLENGQIQYRATPKSDRAMADIPMLAGYESLVGILKPGDPIPGTINWALIAQQILEQPADYGLKRAASAVEGRNLAGVTWQKWRDEFIAEMRTLDPDLQDQLIQRFPAVLG